MALVAVPGNAAAANPLAGATLDSVSSSMTIKTDRCPNGAERTAKTCGHASLKSSFTSAKRPAIKPTRGAKAAKFSGIRVAGVGESRCTSESPSEGPVTGLTGSYDVGSAVHISSAGLESLDLLVATSKNRARWAWTDPINPSEPCKYFYGEGNVEVFSPLALPEFVVTPFLSAATLAKRTFGLTFSANRQFQTSASDGTIVFGDATWTLKLGYKRYAVRK
jgi:hypothetical protein